MCGRLFTNIKPVSDIALLLEALNLLDVEIPTRNNIAPTDPVTVIFHDGTKYAARDMRWWLHPAWQKQPPNQTHPAFNARIETVLTLSSFRVPIQRQRGIVVVDAFVEWQKHEANQTKQPYYVQGKNQPLLLAAIWDIWNNEIYSCAIITQEANAEFSKLHNRMPLSLTNEQALRWLDPSEKAENLIADFQGLSVELTQRKVSPEINNSRNKVNVSFI